MRRVEFIQHPACPPWRASSIEDGLCLRPATRGEPRKLSRAGRASALCRAVASCEGGFTLIELLIVVGIIGVLLVLMAPAFTTMKGGTDVTSAAYTIKGVLETARIYAKANNTYTWVGFVEENVNNPTSPNQDQPPAGRLIMSTVASRDGTMLYTGNLSSAVTLDPTRLIQVGKLSKIENLHLKTFSAPASTPPPDTFDARPAVASTASKIGDDATTAPPN